MNTCNHMPLQYFMYCVNSQTAYSHSDPMCSCANAHGVTTTNMHKFVKFTQETAANGPKNGQLLLYLNVL